MPDKSITITFNGTTGKATVTGGDSPNGNGDMTIQKRNALIQIALADPQQWQVTNVFIRANTPFPPGVYPPPTPDPVMPDEFNLSPNLPTSAVITLMDRDTDPVQTTYYYAIGIRNTTTGQVAWTDPQIVNRPSAAMLDAMARGVAAPDVTLGRSTGEPTTGASY